MTETDLDVAIFKGAIPDLQSALRTGGDGGRVTLEIPEVYMGEFAKLIGMRGKILDIQISYKKQDMGKRYGLQEVDMSKYGAG